MSVQFRSNRREVVGRFKGKVAKNVEDAANHYLNALGQKLRKGSRSGKRYKVPGGKRRTYVASAPGEPPAPRTGNLARSYQKVPLTRYRMLVGSPMKYARYLELGTSRMRPRPHFEQTFTEERRRIEALLSREAV